MPEDGSVNFDVSSARLFVDAEVQVVLKDMPSFRLSNIDEINVGVIYKAIQENNWNCKAAGDKVNVCGDNYLFVKEYDEFKNYCIEEEFLSEKRYCSIL
jgi:hypothetical protein